MRPRPIYPAPWPGRRDVPQHYTFVDDNSSGGRTALPRPATLSNGMIDEVDRFPGNANDCLIARDRQPVYHVEYISSGRDSGLVDWTAAGPIRREIHTRQASLRIMAGNTRSRALDPVPTGLGPQTQGHGLHTTPPTGVAHTSPRYGVTPQMTRPRTNRIAGSQYTGQSYSETTRLQQAGS
jgi:hypothetical protein